MVFTILILLYAGFVGFFNSYGMYTFLRIWVCFVSAFIAWYSYIKYKNQLILFISVVIAILFNPFIEIHLHQSDWEAVDIIAALFYIAITAKYIKTKKKKRIIFPTKQIENQIFEKNLLDLFEYTISTGTLSGKNLPAIFTNQADCYTTWAMLTQLHASYTKYLIKKDITPHAFDILNKSMSTSLSNEENKLIHDMTVECIEIYNKDESIDKMTCNIVDYLINKLGDQAIDENYKNKLTNIIHNELIVLEDNFANGRRKYNI